MDILKEYKEQFPGIKNNSVEDNSAREYGFFIRLVMRLSRGKVNDATKASYVLVGVIMVSLCVALAVVFLSKPSSKDKARFSTVCFPVVCPK